ncbi:MAG: methylenetetrahydrofolate reductase [Spirochaetota bacterium]
MERAGIEWATEQAADLLAHEVRGIHFYTLNRLRPIREVWSAVSAQE